MDGNVSREPRLFLMPLRLPRARFSRFHRRVLLLSQDHLQPELQIAAAEREPLPRGAEGDGVVADIGIMQMLDDVAGGELP